MSTSTMKSTPGTTDTFDAIIIGAGFAGLYAVHKMRDQMGMRVRAFDQASDVGGTWYWNRYPGARCDIESVHYSYSFSEDLQQEWHWSEKFAAQPEILEYLNHVADRFGLRRDIQFDTKITSVEWDEDAAQWVVGTADGETYRAKYFISGAGTLSVPKEPEFPASRPSPVTCCRPETTASPTTSPASGSVSSAPGPAASRRSARSPSRPPG